MGFVCRVCNLRKDGRKKNAVTCMDCFNAAILHQRGKKTKEEEMQEWEDGLKKREETLIDMQKGVQEEKEQLLRDKQEKTRREREIQNREEEMETKEKIELEATLKRKRAAEEGPSGREKRFCDLGTKRRQQLVSPAIEALKGFGRGDVKDILGDVSRRILGEDDPASQVRLLKENIAIFCATHLPSLPDRSRIAAALTRGLGLEEAATLSGVPIGSISWGRGEIKEGRVRQQEVRTKRKKEKRKKEKKRTSHHFSCLLIGIPTSTAGSPR